MGVINEAGRDKMADIPSYSAAAGQQWQSGIQSAIMNQLLNRPNEVTPFGSRTWRQTGSTNVGGQEIPTYQSEIAADPKLQAIINQKMSDASAASSKGPFDLSGISPLYSEADLRQNRDAVTKAMYDRATRFMDPRFAEEEDRLRTELANKGFQEGTTGYDRELSNFRDTKDAAYQDAVDRALIAGGNEQSRLFDLGMKDRVQDIAEQTLTREQPFRELGLAAGFTPSFQNFSATSNIGANPQLQAMIEMMKAEQNAYHLENERTGAITGATRGLFGIGSGK